MINEGWFVISALVIAPSLCVMTILMSALLNKVWFKMGLTRAEYLDRQSISDKLDSISNDINSLSSVAAKRHRMLDNLLATIHGDGGHYIEKHGYEKSTSDAMEIIQDRKNETETAHKR